MVDDCCRIVGGEIRDVVPEAVTVLRRADTGAETRGSKGAERSPFASPPLSTWRRLACLP